MDHSRVKEINHLLHQETLWINLDGAQVLAVPLECELWSLKPQVNLEDITCDIFSSPQHRPRRVDPSLRVWGCHLCKTHGARGLALLCLVLR